MIITSDAKLKKMITEAVVEAVVAITKANSSVVASQSTPQPSPHKIRAHSTIEKLAGGMPPQPINQPAQ